MDPEEYNRLFGTSTPDGDTPSMPSEAPQSPGPKLDPEAAKAVLSELGFAPEVPQQAQPQATAAGKQSRTPQQDPQAQPTEQPTGPATTGVIGALNRVTSPLDPVADALKSAGTGAMKAVFETKDFLFGDTPREQQSWVRQYTEGRNEQLREEAPLINGFSSGVGQFATAMVGLGKFSKAAQAAPWVGRGFNLARGVKGGTVAMESGKAALAGAVAFDPYEERLSNLIQGTPLANPFTAWLAADPNDSAAMGRLKTAMESIGMDAAIIGTFTGSLRIWKYLKHGDTRNAKRAVGELEAKIAQETTPAEDVPTTATSATPDLEAADLDGANLRAIEEATGGGVSPEDALFEANLKAIEDSVSSTKPEVVSNPTQAMEDAGVLRPQKFRNKVNVSGPEAGSIVDDLGLALENAEQDWSTMAQHGQWSGANNAGKRLGPDLGTFYDRFRSDADLERAIDLATAMKLEELTKQGFRVKVSDQTLQRQVRAYASLTGSDPEGMLGILQQAGDASASLTAKMIVSGSLTAKTFQDASLLAQRMQMGDFTEFGSKEAMKAAIGKRFSLSLSLLKITDEIRSQAGRSLRANRGRPFDPKLFEGLTGDRFFDLLAATEGDPTKVKMLADPGLYRKIADTVNYMRIASLVSGPKTQLINIMSNGYMTAVRPLERILGATPGAVVGSQTSRAIVKENLKQYTYMGSAFMDGFQMAVKAFARNDSLLRPHGTEMFGERAGSQIQWQVPGTQGLNAQYFKPWTSSSNLIYNAMSVPLTVMGLPVRALGGVDELVKQTVYRSKLAARAHMEATEEALNRGLTGRPAKDFIKSYVSESMDAAFDMDGRGLDAEALREANIATFQQDLLPGTIGKSVQDLLAADTTQLSRLILPFVRTPTNVIRYAWKMTPGLNRLQTEYRQMLKGEFGEEAKAQAIGQMTLGALFMGAAAYIGAQGMLTGGGPTDPQKKSQLLATGWQPYSFVFENDDGSKRYVQFSRYDPIALPFGIIADIQDAHHILGAEQAAQTPEVERAIGAMMVSLAKQFTSRTYLLSLNQALEALSDPDRHGEAFLGSLAASMVPFSSATRQLSNDPYLREARAIADKMVQVVPGMSETLPPRYNWLGEPVLNRQGLWTDTSSSYVDHETIRLGLEGDGPLGNPSYNLDGVDLREITMADGENAYSAYQRLSGKPSPKAPSLKDVVGRMMQSPAYRKAPDGESTSRGTKLWLLSNIVSKYRKAGGARVRSDPNVRAEIMKAKRIVPDYYKKLKEPITEEKQSTMDNVFRAFGVGQ